MSPLTVACPRCRAQPGQPCRRPNGDRYTTVKGEPEFHAVRRRRAAR